MDNLFFKLSTRDLYDALQVHADELRTPSPRTPEELAQLAQDCAVLMLTAARRLSEGQSPARTPEEALASGRTTFAGAYGGWYFIQARDLRWQVLRRAARHALGDEAERWLRDVAARANAAISDEALLEALQRLEVAGNARAQK